METVNGVTDGDKGGPPPPSPLTGCYLLIVVGEPHSEQHKDIILQRIAKGLLSWDVNDCLVDLEKELAIITEQALEGEEARYGERLIQFASENLVTEILIHPVVSTLAQCMRNLLSSFTRHRHIIHAGYTFAANGSWALQDGTFSLADFSEAFQELEVQRVVRAYENGISLDLHCSPEGDWSRLPKEPFTKACKVRVNPTDVLTTGSPSITDFINYISPFLIPTSLENLLESSDVVGNIRFSRPTLYVFPGGQGDAALFGINGFNMLLDGGFSRKACFWDFVRHLDRLDAVLMTRLNNSNVGGISSVLRRKRQDAVYPQIGHFFCNIQERKAILSPDGDKDKDPLLINLLDEGQEIISNLRHLNLNPQACYRDSEPINLYHKVGHGTLDMYVLSPAKDSKEVREFLQKWNQSDQKLFANSKLNREFSFPVQNLISIAALLIWQPANPTDTITRILYPGSSPQKKIFEGLDRLKNLEFIKHAVCTEKSLAPSSLVKKVPKDVIIEKVMSKEKVAVEKKENKIIENNISLNGDIKEVKEKIVRKSDSTESDRSTRAKKIEETKPIETEEKPKAKPRVPKPRSDSQQRKKPTEKKASPTTPKKTLENGDVRKPIKRSPVGTPAKSAKDATNRKVIESKVRTARPPPVEAKPKIERKPISRRPKGAVKAPISPVKKLTNGVQKPDSISRKGKLDKEGTTDSSTVSTPSADQESVLKKDISKLTQEEMQQLKAQELADLKEEQEAIKEIEAVFRKGEVRREGDGDLRKVKDVSIEDKVEKEEYLIIEKEEIDHDSLEEKEAKEDEIQKLARDSEESEKQRKLSDEEKIIEKQQEIQEQVHEIISEAEDIVKAKEEVVEVSKDTAVTSPEEKIDLSSTDRKTDKEIEEVKDIVSSHPDEKISAIKSGDTTTAPTLPEDERIPLDEIKEDNGHIIEEKHVKEETKEKEVPVIQLPPKTFEPIAKVPGVVGIRLDKQTHIRDIVKTPDEVADLPVHEEVDYEYTHELKAETRTNEIIEEKKDELSQEFIKAEVEGIIKEQVKGIEQEKDKDEVVQEQLKDIIEDVKKTSVMKEELKHLTETVLQEQVVLEKDILKESEKITEKEPLKSPVDIPQEKEIKLDEVKAEMPHKEITEEKEKTVEDLHKETIEERKFIESDKEQSPGEDILEKAELEMKEKIVDKDGLAKEEAKQKTEPEKEKLDIKDTKEGLESVTDVQGKIEVPESKKDIQELEVKAVEKKVPIEEKAEGIHEKFEPPPDVKEEAEFEEQERKPQKVEVEIEEKHEKDAEFDDQRITPQQVKEPVAGKGKELEKGKDGKEIAEKDEITKEDIREEEPEEEVSKEKYKEAHEKIEPVREIKEAVDVKKNAEKAEFRVQKAEEKDIHAKTGPVKIDVGKEIDTDKDETKIQGIEGKQEIEKEKSEEKVEKEQHQKDEVEGKVLIEKEIIREKMGEDAVQEAEPKKDTEMVEEDKSKEKKPEVITETLKETKSTEKEKSKDDTEKLTDEKVEEKELVEKDEEKTKKAEMIEKDKVTVERTEEVKETLKELGITEKEKSKDKEEPKDEKVEERDVTEKDDKKIVKDAEDIEEKLTKIEITEKEKPKDDKEKLKDEKVDEELKDEEEMDIAEKDEIKVEEEKITEIGELKKEKTEEVIEETKERETTERGKLEDEKKEGEIEEKGVIKKDETEEEKTKDVKEKLEEIEIIKKEKLGDEKEKPKNEKEVKKLTDETKAEEKDTIEKEKHEEHKEDITEKEQAKEKLEQVEVTDKDEQKVEKKEIPEKESEDKTSIEKEKHEEEEPIELAAVEKQHKEKLDEQDITEKERVEKGIIEEETPKEDFQEIKDPKEELEKIEKITEKITEKIKPEEAHKGEKEVIEKKTQKTKEKEQPKEELGEKEVEKEKPKDEGETEVKDVIIEKEEPKEDKIDDTKKLKEQEHKEELEKAGTAGDKLKEEQPDKITIDRREEKAEETDKSKEGELKKETIDVKADEKEQCTEEKPDIKKTEVKYETEKAAIKDALKTEEPLVNGEVLEQKSLTVEDEKDVEKEIKCKDDIIENGIKTEKSPSKLVEPEKKDEVKQIPEGDDILKGKPKPEVEEEEKKHMEKVPSVEEVKHELSKQTEEVLKATKEDISQLEKIEDKLQQLKQKSPEPTTEIIEPKKFEEDLDESEKFVKATKKDKDHLEKLEEKLQQLKESADLKIEVKQDTKESDASEEKDQKQEKGELGRKSPKEREEDVIKIVTSVAEVLKSDAPLEEFEGKLPISTYSPYTTTYTTELRETHITTVDSPTVESKVIKTDDVAPIPEQPHAATTSFLEEERKIAPLHESTSHKAEDKRSSLLKESQELMLATSKIISDIKSGKTEEPEDAEEPAAVHRMLVTASSEDGGEETEICAEGSIMFSKSSESSGRSSPEKSQELSKKSSLVDTISDSLSTVKQVRELPSEKDSGIDDTELETQEKRSPSPTDKESGKEMTKISILDKGDDVTSGKSSPDKDASIKSLASGKSSPDISDLEKSKDITSSLEDLKKGVDSSKKELETDLIAEERIVSKEVSKVEAKPESPVIKEVKTEKEDTKIIPKEEAVPERKEMEKSETSPEEFTKCEDHKKEERKDSLIEQIEDVVIERLEAVSDFTKSLFSKGETEIEDVASSFLSKGVSKVEAKPESPTVKEVTTEKEDIKIVSKEEPVPERKEIEKSETSPEESTKHEDHKKERKDSLIEQIEDVVIERLEAVSDFTKSLFSKGETEIEDIASNLEQKFTEIKEEGKQAIIEAVEKDEKTAEELKVEEENIIEKIEDKIKDTLQLVAGAIPSFLDKSEKKLEEVDKKLHEASSAVKHATEDAKETATKIEEKGKVEEFVTSEKQLEDATKAIAVAERRKSVVEVELKEAAVVLAAPVEDIKIVSAAHIVDDVKEAPTEIEEKILEETKTISEATKSLIKEELKEAATVLSAPVEDIKAIPDKLQQESKEVMDTLADKTTEIVDKIVTEASAITDKGTSATDTTIDKLEKAFDTTAVDTSAAADDIKSAEDDAGKLEDTSRTVEHGLTQTIADTLEKVEQPSITDKADVSKITSAIKEDVKTAINDPLMEDVKTVSKDGATKAAEKISKIEQTGKVETPFITEQAKLDGAPCLKDRELKEEKKETDDKLEVHKIADTVSDVSQTTKTETVIDQVADTTKEKKTEDIHLEVTKPEAIASLTDKSSEPKPTEIAKVTPGESEPGTGLEESIVDTISEKISDGLEAAKADLKDISDVVVSAAEEIKVAIEDKLAEKTDETSEKESAREEKDGAVDKLKDTVDATTDRIHTTDYAQKEVTESVEASKESILDKLEQTSKAVIDSVLEMTSEKDGNKIDIETITEDAKTTKQIVEDEKMASSEAVSLSEKVMEDLKPKKETIDDVPVPPKEASEATEKTADTVEEPKQRRDSIIEQIEKEVRSTISAISDFGKVLFDGGEKVIEDSLIQVEHAIEGIKTTAESVIEKVDGDIKGSIASVKHFEESVLGIGDKHVSGADHVETGDATGKKVETVDLTMKDEKADDTKIKADKDKLTGETTVELSESIDEHPKDLSKKAEEKGDFSPKDESLTDAKGSVLIEEKLDKIDVKDIKPLTMESETATPLKVEDEKKTSLQKDDADVSDKKKETSSDRIETKADMKPETKDKVPEDTKDKSPDKKVSDDAIIKTEVKEDDIKEEKDSGIFESMSEVKDSTELSTEKADKEPESLSTKTLADSPKLDEKSQKDIGTTIQQDSTDAEAKECSSGGISGLTGKITDSKSKDVTEIKDDKLPSDALFKAIEAGLEIKETVAVISTDKEDLKSSGPDADSNKHIEDISLGKSFEVVTDPTITSTDVKSSLSKTKDKAEIDRSSTEIAEDEKLLKKEEEILEKSADDLRQTFDIVSDITKSIVFDKCEKPSTEIETMDEKLLKKEVLEKSAKDISGVFETVSDMSKSIIFDKCEKPVAEVKKKSVEDLSFEKCGISTDVTEIDPKVLEKDEKQLEKSADDLKETFERVSKMSTSVSFEKCEKPEDAILHKEEKALEDRAKDLEETFETVADMSKSVVFEKCESLEERRKSIEDEFVQKTAEDLKEAFETVTGLSKSISFDKCDKEHKEKSDSEKETFDEKSPVDLKAKETAVKDIIDKLTIDVDTKSIAAEIKSPKDLPVSVSLDIKPKDSDVKEIIDKIATDVDTKSIDAEVKKSPELLAKDNKLEKLSESTDAKSTVLEKCEKESMEKVSSKPDAEKKETGDVMSHSILIEDKNLTELDSKATLPSLEEQIIKDDIKLASKLEKEILEPKLEKSTLDIGHAEIKKLSISDVEISVPDVKPSIGDASVCPVDASRKLIDTERRLISDEGSEKSDIKEDKQKTDSKDTEEICDKTKESLVSEKIPVSVAGPSTTLEKTKDLSDTATTEDERQKELHDTLLHEKHIPGSVTPPTAPVSPHVMESYSEDIKLTTRTEALIKEMGLRSSTPGSDDFEIITSTQSDISSGQVSKMPLDSEKLDSDEDDPLSVTSQVAHSRDSSHYDLEEDSKICSKIDPMSMSFYGALPDDPPEESEKKAEPSYLYEITKAKYTSIDEADTKLDQINKNKQKEGEASSSSVGKDEKDPIESWGKPLGLPAPPTYLYEITKARYTAQGLCRNSEDCFSAQDDYVKKGTYLYEVTEAKYHTELRDEGDDLDHINQNEHRQNMMAASFYGNLPSDFGNDKDPIASWGKPLGLPSPAPPNDNKGTPKKERKLPPNVTAKNKLNDDKKRAESPSKYNKNRKINPVYLDLTYVPHHGNSYYSYVDFFKRIRARYYVFSGIEPSREVYNALLEAKQSWEDKDLEVTIIPTYDTDILGYWVAENEELLTKYKIDLSPSASRCTINLQDHETSCSAYRLEF